MTTDSVRHERPVRLVKTNEPALLPQNEAAEAGVLGSILIEPDKLADVRTILAPECFYNEDNRLVCQYAYELDDQGVVPDLITLPDALERSGKMDANHARQVVHALVNQVPHSASAVSYAKIVKRDYLKRELIRVGGEIAGVAYREDDVQGALAYTKSLVEQVASDAQTDEDDDFRILSDLEAEALPPQQGIVGDILFEDSLAFLYGPSGTWKSFVAVAMGMSIATATPFFGRDVEQGDVVYIASEGGRGIGKRIHAWKRQHGFVGQRTGMHVIGRAINLMDAASVEQYASRIAEVCEAPKLIVIDTLARSMPGGDENLQKDVNTATDNADILKRAFGCCVLIIHHTGKDSSRGARGSSGLKGNTDTMIQIVGGEGKPRMDIGDCLKINSEKPKEDDPFKDICFTTEKVSWVMEDGTPVSSLVVVPFEGEMPEPVTPRAKITSADRLLVLMKERGEPAYHADLKRAFCERYAMSPRSFDNAREELERAGKIENVGGMWRVKAGEA